MGVTVVQCGHDRQKNTLSVAEHLIVPKADHSISLAFDDRRTRRVNFGCVLAAIDFDDELGPMTSKIGDVVADRYLAPEMPFGEVLPKQSPNRTFRIGHVSAKSTGSPDSVFWRVMLHERPCNSPSP